MGELITNVTFKEKTLKLKMFVMRNTIFSVLTGWNNSNYGINSFCQKIQNLTAEADKLKEELKGTFPQILTDGLSRCKMSAKFELKPNIQTVFKK